MVQQNADVSQLLEALQKVKPFPQTAPARRTNLQDKIVANRDYAIGSIAQAPTLRNKIDSIKSSGGIPKNGTPKSLLFNNPITKTIFGGLKVIDTPHRMVVSGLREVVDAFDNDPNTRASFDDWIGQVGKDDYGFGTAFPVAGWGGRVLGLVGDVITDPLFWIRPYGAGAGKLATLADGAPLKTALGKTAIAGAPGRNALADYAIRMGRSPQEVANIGYKGRLGATPEFAKMAGLDKAGLYIAGTKIKLPFSGPIADAASFGAFTVRSTFVNSKIGGALHRLVTTGDDYIKNLKIGVSTGKLDAPKAQEAIQLLNMETRKRAVSGVARNTFVSGIKNVVEGPEYNEYGKSVYQIMDPKEGFARAPKSAQEKAYAVKIQNILRSAIGDVKTRLNVVDPEAKVGEFIEYWPHMTSEAGINYMAVPTNPYAETTFKFLKEDLFDKDGSFKTRKLKASSDGKANWFGHALTQDDIDKGIDRLNQLARDGGFVGDFFETDVAAVLSRYGKFYGEQIGKIDYADSLLKSNIGRLRTTHSIIDNEYFDEFANQTAEVSGSVARSTTELIDGINSATKEIERIVGSETKLIGAKAGVQTIENLTRRQKEIAGSIQGTLKQLDALRTNVNQRVEKFESLFDFNDPNDPAKLMKAVFEDYKKSSTAIDRFIERSIKDFGNTFFDFNEAGDNAALKNILFPSQASNILADTLNQGKIISDEKALKIADKYATPVANLLLPLKKFQDDLNRINADYELLERRFKLTQMVGNEFAEVVNSILNRSIFETGTLIEKDGKLIANNLPMELEGIAKLLMPSSNEGRILLGFQTDDKMGDFAIRYFETAEGKNLKSIIDPEDLFRKADLRKKGSETIVDFDEFRSVLATSNPSVSDVLTLRRVISNYAMRDIKKYGSVANLPPSLRTKFDTTLAKLTQLNEFQDKVEKVVRTANGNPDFIKNFDKLDEALEEIGQRITQTTARITALTETNTYAKFAEQFTSLANSRSGSIVPRDLDELRSLSGNITKGKQLYDDFIEEFIKVYDEQQEIGLTLSWEQLRNAFNSQFLAEGISLNAREADAGEFFINLSKELEDDISNSEMFNRFQQVIQDAKELIAPKRQIAKKGQTSIAPDPSFVQSQYALQQNTSLTQQELTELKSTVGKLEKDLAKQKDLVKQRKTLFSKAGVKQADFDHIIDSTSSWEFGTKTSTTGQRASVGQVILETQDAAISYYIHSETTKFMEAVTEKFAPLGYVPNERFSLYAVNQLGKQLGQEANYAVTKMNIAKTKMEQIQSAVRNAAPDNQVRVFNTEMEKAFLGDDEDGSFDFLFGQLKQLLPSSKQQPQRAANTQMGQALRADIVRDIVEEFRATRERGLRDPYTNKLIGGPTGYVPKGKPGDFMGQQTSLSDVYDQDKTLTDWVGSVTDQTTRNPNTRIDYLSRSKITDKDILTAADVPTQMSPGVRPEFETLEDALAAGVSENEFNAMYRTPEATRVASEEELINALRNRLERTSISKLLADNKNLGNKYQARWDKIVEDFKPTISKTKRISAKRAAAIQFGPNAKLTIPKYFRNAFNPNATPRDIQTFFVNVFGGVENIPGGDFSVTKIRGGKIVKAPAGQVYKKELSESSSYVNARIAAAQKRSTQFSLMQDSLSDPKSVLENPLNIALGPTGHAMMLREMASSIKKQIELSTQTREIQKGLLAKKQKRMGLYYSRKYGEELWSTLIKNSYNPNTKLLDVIQDIKNGKISVTLKKQVEQLEDTLAGLGDKEVTGALAKQKQLITELKSFETAQRKLTTLKTQIDNLTMEPIEVVAKQEQSFNSWLNEVSRINGNEVLNEFGQPIWSYESGTYMFDKSLEKQINQRFGNNVQLYDTEVLDSNAIMQSGALRMRRTSPKSNKSSARFVQSNLMKRITQGEIKAVNVDGVEYGTTFSVSFGTDSIDVVLPPSSPLLDIDDATRETVSAYGRQELAEVLGDYIYGSNRALGAPGLDFANEIQISVSPNKDYVSSLEKGMREGNVSFVKIKKRINYGEYLSPTNMHAVVPDGPFGSTVRSFSARDYAATSPLRTAIDANGLPIGDITFTPSEWRALFPTQEAKNPLVVRNLRASDNAAAKRLEKRLGQIPAELSQLEQRYKKGLLSPTAHAKGRKKLNLELIQSESMLNDLEQSIRLYDDELRAPQTRLTAMNKLRSFYEGFSNLDEAKDWVNGQIRNGQKLNIANIEPRPDDALLRREIINSNWDNSDYGKHIRQKEQLEKLLTEEFDKTYPLIAQERDVLSYHDSLVEEAIQLEKRFAAVDVPAMMEKRTRFQEQLQESGFNFDAFAAPGDAKKAIYEKIRTEAEDLFAGIPPQTQIDDYGKTADFYVTNQILDTFGGEAQIDNYVLEKLTDLFGREGAAKMMLQTEFDTASTVAFADYADNVAKKAQANVVDQMQKLQPIDFQFKTAIAGSNVEIIDPVTREIFQIRQGEELDALRVIRATKTADLNDMINAMGNLRGQVAFDLSKIIRRLRPGYIEQLTKYKKTLEALSQYADNFEGTVFVPKNLGMLDEPISLRGVATGTPGVREGLSDATYARLFSDVKQPKDVRDALVRKTEMQTESEQIENLFKNINNLEATYATKLGVKTKIDEQLNTLNSTIKKLEASKNKINNLPKLADNAKQQEIDEATEIIDESVALIAQIRSEANMGAESTGFIPRELRKVMLDLSNKRANYSKALLDSENLDFAAEGIIADFGTNNLPTKQVLEEFDNGWAQLSSAFPSIYVPESVAEIFNNVHRLQDPAIVIAMQRGLGTYNKFFKTYATLSPGFHVRNAYNNVFVHLAGGEGFKWIPEALGVIKKWEIAQGNKTTWEEFIAGLSPEQSRRALIARDAVVASGDGLYDSVNADLAFGSKLMNWKLPQLSKRAGHWSDYVSRFTYAYSAAANGGEFLDVTARVQKYFIDYSTKSNLDKVMTQIVPFWMFASRNFPLHLQNVYHNPRVYQGYRAIRQNMSEKDNEQNNDIVPAWLRESGAWKLPIVGNWYATPDLGFMRIQTEVNRLQDPKRFLADVTPALRLPIELAGDRRFFANKKFSKVPIEAQQGTALNALQPLLQALGYGQTGPDGRQFVSDKASYGVMNALPFLGQAERLSATTSPNTGDASPNSLLGYLGLPVRQNTPQMQMGELNAQKQAMQEAMAAYNAVNRPQE